MSTDELVFQNGFSLQLVDLRDEIAEYEREYRPFPPRSGSVSKPMHPSTEPEHDNGFKHVKFAKHGDGIPVGYKITFREGVSADERCVVVPTLLR